MKTVVAIHTAMPMVEPTKALFAKHLPDVRLINIVDDSLIQDVIQSNTVPHGVSKRLINYYFIARDVGADIIFNTCSSVGDVAIHARDLLDVPIVKIDDAMAEEAVLKYKKIGVLATLQTTMEPTVRLLHCFAKKHNKKCIISESLANGAFEAIINGDQKLHDSLIMEAANKIAPNVDAIVLAQGSMARMETKISELTCKPILSSPERGVLSIQNVLNILLDS